ncbi:type VI secretion system-associated FHA domain protein TagH [Vibrio ouci]|uniref:Type VI secretion system-associated FHA domain protein TagH n=2 Tax=Vibrio ouci TaxID=2499078 RepID=A0A4Y8WEJ0_9VIBR|nr:type VI secretion system-associated FHA domain protein TagH [Vibrio ouci]
MMGKSPLTKLTLLVTNVQKLESRLSALMEWGVEGGIVGSDDSAHWLLSDSKGEVFPEHCEILMLDGAFCLKDLCGETYINGSVMPVGKELLAKLAHNDHIRIGPYEIRVIVGDLDTEICSESLNTLFSEPGADLLSNHAFEQEPAPKNKSAEKTDPLDALGDYVSEKTQSLIDDEPKNSNDSVPASLGLEEDLSPQESGIVMQADSNNELSSSMMLKRILNFGFRSKQASKPEPNTNTTQKIESSQVTGIDQQKITTNVLEGFQMDEQELDLLEEEVAKSLPTETSSDVATSGLGGHLLTGPLLNGLGAQLSGTDDIARMQMLSQELGESLQSCIKGILALHQQVNQGRFGTLNRNLQPIEDNPLRLGLSYQETIQTLYDSNKSAVHLSAPFAIEESLANVQAHNEAMQYATGEALTQILGAFSPDVLLSRFQNYKRSHQSSVEDGDAWAWQMYCSYYQELASHRQQGFEKLFWEIFEQSYDRKIREKQLEY